MEFICLRHDLDNASPKGWFACKGRARKGRIHVRLGLELGLLLLTRPRLAIHSRDLSFDALFVIDRAAGDDGLGIVGGAFASASASSVGMEAHHLRLERKTCLTRSRNTIPTTPARACACACVCTCACACARARDRPPRKPSCTLSPMARSMACEISDPKSATERACLGAGVRVGAGTSCGPCWMTGLTGFLCCLPPVLDAGD
jgi:hypothetical protein